MTAAKSRPKRGAAAKPSRKPDGTPRIELMPVRALAAWPGNPREHDVAALRASMRRFGAIEPPVVDERSGKLVVGHGRSLGALAAMEADGEDPPRYVVVRGGAWHLPVLRGIEFESVREAEAYLLASNRQAERGGWNPDGLAETLARHVEQLEGIGWNPEEAADVIAAAHAAAPEVTPPTEFPEHDAGQKKTHDCPKCGFKVVCDA